MFDPEHWLPFVVVACTVFSLFLLSLPSTYGAERRFVRVASPSENRVQVVVLGDIGRSPRIQYHALSIAKHGGFVDLVGYKVSELHPEIGSSPRITVHDIAVTPNWLKSDKKWSFLLLAPFKVVLQTCSLYYTLGYRTPPAKWLLVQIICFLRNTQLIIDWHNFGFSILGLKLGPTHPLVRVARLFEQTFSAKAYAHLVVSNAMARALREEWKLLSPILPLHDRPFAQFQPLGKVQRLNFLARCPETTSALDEIQQGTMKLLVSSTSWTADEDFSLLLNAFIAYSDKAASTRSRLPKILAIITGKGQLKNAFLSKIRTASNEGKLERVHVKTAWLSSEDYAKLLASADLGISMHTSSSGVDLPMKVLDMLGAGLPVIGWDEFEAWPELIQEGVNGRGFHSSDALSDMLVTLLGDDAQQLQHLRQGALLAGRRRWDDEWDPVLGKLLGLCK
ncbi:MAG: hypothetical protein Q9170_000737 [Blastenia crenularia]